LWVTDGTAAGTHELNVAGALTAPADGGLPAGLGPSNLTVYDGDVFFGGDDASGAVGLWETDGTASGTHELTGIVGVATVGQNGGAPGIFPGDLTVYNGQLLFSGDDAHGQTGLWESNGTASGTHELTGIVGAPTSGKGLDPSYLTVINGHALFNGLDSSGQLGLWETDGTAAGTHELTGIALAAGTGLDPVGLTVFNGQVLFAGLDSSGQFGLWETDGTVAGTHELTGIAGAQTKGTGLAPSDLTVYNGEVLFRGRDSSGKLGLWETNGSVGQRRGIGQPDGGHGHHQRWLRSGRCADRRLAADRHHQRLQRRHGRADAIRRSEPGGLSERTRLRRLRLAPRHDFNPHDHLVCQRWRQYVHVSDQQRVGQPPSCRSNCS
jgi:ELWxxDGT repeat protein